MDTTLLRINELRALLAKVNTYAQEEGYFYTLYSLIEQQYFKECLERFPNVNSFGADLLIVINEYANPYFRFKGRSQDELFTQLYNDLVDATHKAIRTELNRLEGNPPSVNDN